MTYLMASTKMEDLMKRQQTLDAASVLINRDRAATYGDAFAMHSQIAFMWGAILKCTIRPHQVALLMAALKLARAAHNPKHEDSYIDLIGYAALASEMANGDDE
jgi:hypothetical protein